MPIQVNCMYSSHGIYYCHQFTLFPVNRGDHFRKICDTSFSAKDMYFCRRQGVVREKYSTPKGGVISMYCWVIYICSIAIVQKVPFDFIFLLHCWSLSLGRCFGQSISILSSILVIYLDITLLMELHGVGSALWCSLVLFSNSVKTTLCETYLCCNSTL